MALPPAIDAEGAEAAAAAEGPGAGMVASAMACTGAAVAAGRALLLVAGEPLAEAEFLGAEAGVAEAGRAAVGEEPLPGAEHFAAVVAEAAGVAAAAAAA